VLPVLVVLALLGVIYLIRLVLGFVFGAVGLLVVIALVVLGYLFFRGPRT
jgi:hypothetical protein